MRVTSLTRWMFLVRHILNSSTMMLLQHMGQPRICLLRVHQR
nr:hypothetical protein Iba_scaffold31770CG0060 [Ipomoea batatas]